MRVPTETIAASEAKFSQVAPEANSSSSAQGDRPPARQSGIESSTSQSTQAEPGTHSSGSWTLRLQRYWDERRTPAFLISIILHTLVLLLLVLLTRSQDQRVGFTSDFILQNDFDVFETTPLTQLEVGNQLAPPQDRMESDWQEPTNTTRASQTINEVLNESGPRKSTSEVRGDLDRLLRASSVSLSASFAATGVEGRQLANREQIALVRGGSIRSEQAVERALSWLSEHQLPNGSWSLIHSAGRCDGRCANDGSKDRFDTAATGLSLLAYLGAGYTHTQGKYREVVRKGVYFLLQVMEETPQGGSFLYQCDRGMYNHGISTFALCEAFQLTDDSALRKPAQQAVDFIVAAQSYGGGWGYLPKQPGDLTLSGWQVMALKSAFAAGLDVPSHTILRVDEFLNSQQMPDGVYYGYGKPGNNPTCTSIGHLLRLFRGMTHSDPRVLEAAGNFRKSGFSRHDVYFNYYASLFLFHVGEPFWGDWNPVMREFLIESQATAGHAAGSWYFDHPYGREGGRLYTTAMCAMTLEVYYRFAPLYQQSDQPFEL